MASLPNDLPAEAEAILALIASRRSHRVGFDRVPISDDVLAAVARSGLAAPSSKNARPWRLHVVTDAGLIGAIAADVATADGVESYVPADPETGLPRADWQSTVVDSAAILRGAPAAIFVENLGRFSNGRATLARAPRDALGGLLIAYMLECAGLGAAVQNMWLAAEALGLKAAFLGDIGVDEERIAKRLGMDGELIGALALGYSDLVPEERRPIDDDPTQVRWHRAGIPDLSGMPE